ncbi:MAG TPA: NAD(P)-dependent oxidoreductase [Gemmatimonadaceae bacterium]|nr:NAD(P)-dependent oxidoreductase [Gemmatimonadaceae bacterium]
MQVLITGGAGYVGSTLVPLLLAAGYRVRVLDALLHGGQSLLGVWAHPGFEFMKGDVRDARTVRDALASVDAVVHLAAIVGDPACARNPVHARAVNLDASVALLTASREAGVARFVFASTCSNYGKMSDPTRYVDERSALAPVSLYAETKVAVEEALLASAGAGGLCATPLRFATVFGVSPRMRFDLTVNEFTMEMLTKSHLVVFGEQFWRPYVHVADAARAIALVLEAPASAVNGRVFNVGSTTQNYQKQQLVELIQQHAPAAVVEYVHKHEDPRDYRVSFARITGDLGFEITRTVEEGIREVARLIADGVIQDYSNARYRN